MTARVRVIGTTRLPIRTGTTALPLFYQKQSNTKASCIPTPLTVETPFIRRYRLGEWKSIRCRPGGKAVAPAILEEIEDLQNKEIAHLLEKLNMVKKQYKYLYQKMLKEETIIAAWKNLRKGKTKRIAVQKIEAHFTEEVKAMQERIRNTKPEGYEVDHPELAYEPPKERKTKIVNEYGKRRKAYLAEIKEQWYFHIIVETLKPIVLKHLHPGVCGCVPRRGPHSGKQMIEKALKGNVRYFFKGDIRHFYDSLRIDVIIRQMRRYIADDLFLYCIKKIYKYKPKGIMIGLYISPWIANFVLIDFDKIIIERGGTYLRYVDDIVIMDHNKKRLRETLSAIKWTLGQLRLRLKRTWQICRFDYKSKRGRIGRALDFMGFVFFRDRTVMRKHIMIDGVRCARKLAKAKAEGRRFYGKLTRAFISRLGWFQATDSYDCYLKYIKPIISVRKVKQIISKQDKEDKRHERLDKRNLQPATA